MNHPNPASSFGAEHEDPEGSSPAFKPKNPSSRKRSPTPPPPRRQLLRPVLPVHRIPKRTCRSSKPQRQRRALMWRGRSIGRVSWRTPQRGYRMKRILQLRERGGLLLSSGGSMAGRRKTISHSEKGRLWCMMVASRGHILRVDSCGKTTRGMRVMKVSALRGLG